MGSAAYDALISRSAVLARRDHRQRKNIATGMASALIALALGCALGVTLLHLDASAQQAGQQQPAASEQQTAQQQE